MCSSKQNDPIWFIVQHKNMSKVVFHDDSDDDDIWDYQPKFSQLKKPLGSQRGAHQKKKPGRTRNTLCSQTKTARPECEKTLTENQQSETSGVDDRTTRFNHRQKSSKQRLSEKNSSKVKTESISDHDAANHRNTLDEVPKKSKTNTRRRLKTPKVKVEAGTAAAGKLTEKREGFCPVCQMPYAALSIVQSPTWHIHECLETPYSSKKECPNGLSCDCTIASHYKKFHHRQLARHRARLKSAESSSSDTKRKIEFDQQSGKENIPDNTGAVNQTSRQETPDTADVLPDSNRNVDQMLMDALGDNDNSNDIGYEQNPASQVIQSETCNSNNSDDINENITGAQDGLVRNTTSAIILTDDETVENTCTGTMDSVTPSRKSNTGSEVSTPQSSFPNIEPRKESSHKPSFFELSQSAQKLGFFAKKKRQRNQTSTSVVKEEVPSKKAKKSLEKQNKVCEGRDSKVKKKLKNITDDDLVGDKNNNSTNDSVKDKTDDVHQDTKGAITNDPSDTVTVKKEKLSGSFMEEKPDTEESSQNELHIKIGDIRSEALDIFYGPSGSTGIINKPLVKDVNDDSDAEISTVDDVSSDTESSRPDIFSSDIEEGYTEMETEEIHSVSMDENPDLMEASLRLGGGGFIIESQNYKGRIDNNSEATADADITLTNIIDRQEFDGSSKHNRDSHEKVNSVPEGSNKAITCTSTSSDALPNEIATPKAEKISDSKCSPLMNAFSILMQKGKSLSNKLLNRKSSTQTGKNAMDILMSNSGKQNGQPDVKPKREWSLVQGAGDDEASYSENGREQKTKRSCPFYKKIPGTPFTVDAFRYGNIPDCKAYFLTHFHYDHYGGLTKKFSNPIYCTQITCNLVKTKIKTDSRYIHPVSLNTPTVVEGTEVTFLDANHCPGSVLILFKLRNGKVFLHTGDFRANPKMEVYPSLVDLHVHSLYLDTTYCDPQYTFPPQEDVISCAVRLALDARTANPKTLIVCGSYTIGKERIFTAIAEALNCKISVMRDKKMVLDCLDDPGMSSRVSLRWEDSGLHVLPMGKLNYKGLDEHLRSQGDRFDCVLAMEPTGWACNKQFKSLAELKPKLKRDRITLYGVPYSEHSSYLEMKRFVQFIRPDKILPTVNNGNVHSRKKMEVIFEKWNSELKQKR